MKIRLLFILCWCFLQVNAQVTNTGQDIFISDQMLVSVNGTYVHESGSIDNNGNLLVSGDWENNDNKSYVFTNSSTGVVDFWGNDQNIGGTDKTIFSTVVLSGSGVKKLGTDIDINQKLYLNNLELAADHFALSITNSDVKAIERSVGYISTSLRGGKLIRTTNGTDGYLFPLGASFAGEAIYRPLEIEVKDAALNSFAVSLLPKDPTDEGYSRERRRPDVQNVFDRYFYLLNQETGSSQADVKVFRNTIVDGNSTQLVSWNSVGLWEKVGPSSNQEGVFSDNLDKYYLFTSLSQIKDLPLSFSDNLAASPLTFFNAFSPDGDGKNDTWVIKNLEYYPQNTLIVFNRWGDEVFKASQYDNSKAWDGGSLSSGTYYYILNVVIDGKMNTYKGFVTMRKKD